MDLSKYRQLYLSETQENLEKISQLLVGLETSPNDRRAIDTVFRLVHSIKGMSGTMGYTPVFELAHHLEDLMDRFRRLQVPMSTAAIDVLLAGADRIGQWLGDVENEQLPLRADAPVEALHRRIQQLIEGRLEALPTPSGEPGVRQATGPQPIVRPPRPTGPVEPGDILITAEIDPASPEPGLRGFLLHRKLSDLGRIRTVEPDLATLRQGHLDGPLMLVLQTGLDVSQVEAYLTLVPDLKRVHVRREEPPKAEVALIPPPEPEVSLTFSPDFAPEPATPAPSRVESRGGTPLVPAFTEVDFEDLLGDTVREEPDEPAPAPAPIHRDPPTPMFHPPGPEPELTGPEVAEAAIVRAPRAARSVRVRTDWLDAVLNRTGDLLVIAQRLWNRNQADPDPVMSDALSELSRVLNALHQDALSVRMTPLSVLTARLPRAVRDMARRAGKRALLLTQGDDQHLDRAIIEGLDAPLTHLLSNAIEHGIERPEERARAGKRPTGTITLTCLRVRDEIVVEIADDGGGVDRRKLADRAVEMGLLTRNRAEALAERDLARLLCLPGLTSKDEPGENAGRGVGLDAVREMVTTLGGHLEIASEAGAGTTVRLRLPRTPGITRLLLVEADGQVFGLPLSRVVNTEMFDAAQVEPGRFIPHREQRLRLQDLRTLIGFPRRPPEGDFPGVVCSGEEGNFVLAVDRVVGQQDAVAKPLGPLLERIDGLLGITVDPAGQPVLIVDVLRFLAQRNGAH